MGSGASKKTDQKQNGLDDDDDEDFDTYTKKKAENKGQPKLEQAGLLPKLAPTTNKKPPGPRTIIDLIDSDDEDEIAANPRKVQGQSKANGNGKKTNNDEKTLKNEILELEKTFESLDMDRKTPTPRTGLFRTTSIAATAFMPQFLPYGNRPNRPGGGPNRTSLQSGGFFANPAPKTLKFSWEESSTPIAVDKNTDEWTYKQTVIDGFDPAKFRQANNKKESKGGNIPDNGIRVERQFGSASSNESRGARMATIEMPGVPSYDRTEKQLLASLEQELGVL